MKLKKIYESIVDPQQKVQSDVNNVNEAKNNFNQLLEKFNGHGNTLYNMNKYREIAEYFSKLAQGAEAYLLSETENGFDQITQRRNIKELKSYVTEFSKVSGEAQALQERMAALYEDMGIILNRYFDVPDNGLIGEGFSPHDDFNVGDATGYFTVGDIVGYHGREGEIVDITDDSYIVYFSDTGEKIDIDAEELYMQNNDEDFQLYEGWGSHRPDTCIQCHAPLEFDEKTGKEICTNSGLPQEECKAAPFGTDSYIGDDYSDYSFKRRWSGSTEPFYEAKSKKKKSPEITINGQIPNKYKASHLSDRQIVPDVDYSDPSNAVRDIFYVYRGIMSPSDVKNEFNSKELQSAFKQLVKEKYINKQDGDWVWDIGMDESYQPKRLGVYDDEESRRQDKIRWGYDDETMEKLNNIFLKCDGVMSNEDVQKEIVPNKKLLTAFVGLIGTSIQKRGRYWILGK